MTQTGGKADQRLVIPPNSEIIAALLFNEALVDKGVSGTGKNAM